jgi:hypothetical protein
LITEAGYEGRELFVHRAIHGLRVHLPGLGPDTAVEEVGEGRQEAVDQMELGLGRQAESTLRRAQCMHRKVDTDHDASIVLCCVLPHDKRRDVPLTDDPLRGRAAKHVV